MNKISKNELEGMMPDYIFGKLSAEESEAFELNIKNYPDLMHEINEAKALFLRIDATDFENAISKKTRNIGVKVRQRTQRKAAKFGKFQIITRFVLPAAAVLAIFVYTIFIPQRAKDDNAVLNYISQKINSDEIRETLFEDDEFDFFDYNFATVTNQDNIFESQSEFIDEIYFDEILENYEQIVDYLNSKVTYANTKTLLINSINEDEFQDILKELENVGKIF